MSEEKVINLKEHEKNMQLFHIIDLDIKCEISIHAMLGVSTPQALQIIEYIKK